MDERIETILSLLTEVATILSELETEDPDTFNAIRQLTEELKEEVEYAA